MALKVKICSFRREEDDKLELTTPIKKQQLVFLHIDEDVPQNSRDIMKHFEVVNGRYQVNVVIVRAGKEDESDSKPLAKSSRKARRPRVYRV